MHDSLPDLGGRLADDVEPHSGVFGSNDIQIVQAQVFPLPEQGGTKHIYSVKCIPTAGKLSDDQIKHIGAAIKDCVNTMLHPNEV